MILARNLKNPRKVLPRNATFFLVFLSRSWIVLVFLFSCQEIRKISWIVSMILQKLLYLVKNICKDLCQKLKNQKTFLARSPTFFFGSIVKFLDVLGFFCFLGRNSEIFLEFFYDLDKKSNNFLGFLVKILDSHGFLVFLPRNPKNFLDFLHDLAKTCLPRQE